MKTYYIDEFVNHIAPTYGRCIDMSAQVKDDSDDFLYETCPSSFQPDLSGTTAMALHSR